MLRADLSQPPEDDLTPIINPPMTIIPPDADFGLFKQGSNSYSGSMTLAWLTGSTGGVQYVLIPEPATAGLLALGAAALLGRRR
jgi:hypothetical protein